MSEAAGTQNTHKQAGNIPAAAVEGGPKVWF